MESDTLHRMQAAVGSQIPPLVAALGGALSRLSEPQRHWLADDLVRDGLSREEATRRARLEFGSPIFLESSDGGLANWIDHVPYRRRAL